MLKLLERKLGSENLIFNVRLLLNDIGVIFRPKDWNPEYITAEYSATMISYLLGKILKIQIWYIVWFDAIGDLTNDIFHSETSTPYYYTTG